jgi:alditol oxidase
VHEPINCTTAGHGSWVHKSCHFLPEGKPSSGGNEIQIEYYLPYKKFVPAMFKLYENRSIFIDLVQVTEFRMMAKDGIPMSQAKDDAVVGIHWTMVFDHTAKKLAAIHACVPKLEAVLKEFDARPHYGKLFGSSGNEFESMFGKDLLKLRQLMQKHDPKGRLHNAFIDKYILNRKLAKL